MIPSNARLVVVCGLPGSGKTTLAKQLESNMPALRLSADDWMNDLSVNLHEESSRAKIEALQWTLTKRLLVLGEKVIVEWGAWSKAERTRLRNEARALGAVVELHYLAAPLEELFARIQKRGAEDPPITWEALQDWVSLFEPPTAEEMALFDRPLASTRKPDRANSTISGQFSIRRAMLSDRDVIQDIRQRAFSGIYASWRELLGETVFDIEYGDADQRQAKYLDSLCENSSPKELYVLLSGSSVIGFLAVALDAALLKGEIDLNAVDPDYQGHGAGTYLYHFAVSRLKEKGATLIKVGTGLDGAHYRARRAYEKAGFVRGIPGITLFQLSPSE